MAAVSNTFKETWQCWPRSGTSQVPSWPVRPYVRSEGVIDLRRHEDANVDVRSYRDGGEAHQRGRGTLQARASGRERVEAVQIRSADPHSIDGPALRHHVPNQPARGQLVNASRQRRSLRPRELATTPRSPSERTDTEWERVHAGALGWLVGV
jgi:hypothetical protein